MSRFLAPWLVLFAPLAFAQDTPLIAGKTLKDWQAALKNAEPRVRYQALTALNEAGADAIPALDDIARLLKDSQPSLRRAVAQTLANLGEGALPQAAALARALRDPDAGVRQLAGNALIELGTKILPNLEPVFKEGDIPTRLTVLEVLSNMDLEGNVPALTMLTGALKDTSVQVRHGAVGVLGKLVAAKEAQDALALALRDKDGQLRNAAARALLEQGKEMQGHFVEAAKDPSSPVRLTALQALLYLKEEVEKDAILVFRAALSDDDAKVRTIAAGGLGHAGVKARELGGGREVLTTLVKLLHTDKDTGVRQAAMYALGKVGLDDKADLNLLAEGLKDSQAIVRASAIEALSQYSHDEAPKEWRQQVVSLVLRGLGDKDRRVQLLAAQLLVGEGTRAVEGLLQVLESTATPPRLLALQILAEIGADAAEAIPVLERLIRDGPKDLRGPAEATLKAIMP